MSQSDYIKYKRVSRELSVCDELLPPIFEYAQFHSYKGFALENTIANTKYDFYRLLPDTTRTVFGILRPNAMNEPTFLVDYDTNLRGNKIPLLDGQFQPKPSRPIALKTVKRMYPDTISLQNSKYCKCGRL